jgi:hypothetical protein
MVVLGLRSEHGHLSHGRTENGEHMIERVQALLAELEMLVDECRDEKLSDFYHDGRNSAEFAGAFDELNELLRNGAALPTEWRRK